MSSIRRQHGILVCFLIMLSAFALLGSFDDGDDRDDATLEQMACLHSQQSLLDEDVDCVAATPLRSHTRSGANHATAVSNLASPPSRKCLVLTL